MKLLNKLFVKKNIKEIRLPREETAQDLFTGRKLISSLYIKGNGIEIGALHGPLEVFGNANVKYVDRMSTKDLRNQYPELDSLNLVEVDIIDDGEKLSKIKDASQDFVIANHFLEHCQNPILTLKNMLRVVRLNGVVYLAVPDKKYTFDVDRPITKFEHLEKDYIDNGASSRINHFKEWVEYVDKIKDEKAKNDRVNAFMDMNYSIHFHVWTQNEILDFLVKTKTFLPFEVEMFNKNGHEIIFVLSKI